jgi:two-component system, chemotaxis family, sensor kinase CheA
MKPKKPESLGTSFKSLLESKEDIDIDVLEGSDILADDPPSKAPEPIAIDDIEILHSFIEESKDHLENIEEKILSLEKTNDQAMVDDIFRSMHTMKGTSAFFGFSQIKDLSHALEFVLDALRTDQLELGSGIVDVLLAGTDVLAQQIRELDTISAGLQNSSGSVVIPPSEVDIRSIMARIAEVNGQGTAQTAPVEPPAPDNSFDELITPEIQENFISESTDLLDATEEQILQLEKNPQNKEVLDGAFRCIHTMKGNAGFLGLSHFEQVCMEIESVLDAVRNDSRSADQRVIGVILTTIDSLRKAVGAIGEASSGSTGQDDATADDGDLYKPLGEILVEMGAVSHEEIEDALSKQERRIGEILVEEGKVTDEALSTALSAQSVSMPGAEAGGGRVERKDIRVDMAKLDKLFDLMGELITAEAMVINNPELEGLELDRFNTAANYLSKITREMQEITMTVRMIPLEGLFNKMKRLVRDLSRRFDKEISFEVSGQETEMDRNVIEEIADPLMHIIRNAIDHGVEDAESRSAKGKELQGTIGLSAKYEGNEIWISIKDDGKGLDRERILKKAEEQDLLKTDAETMTDEEVWQLVFEAGFSTAETVSEISGRGVGMDVVKRNVEKLRGKIDIESETGNGTEIILKIPLTLAIIDGITAKVGNVLYAIPLGDILEFHKTEQGQITKTDASREVLNLRENIIPIIKLYSFFGTTSEKTETLDGILIVTQRHGRKAALLVDEIIGYHQIVVKALPDYLARMRAISGCSILGDGEVSLIIDVGSLLSEELE